MPGAKLMEFVDKMIEKADKSRIFTCRWATLDKNKI